MTSIPRPANTHIHLPPNFSAFDTVEQAVTQAAAEGLCVLGTSNYYDYSIYRPFSELCRQHGITPLYGLEIIILRESEQTAGRRINDPANPGRMYLCGKGICRFDPLPPRAQDLLGVIRRQDSERMAKVVDRLRWTLAKRGLPVALDTDRIRDQIGQRHGVPLNTVYLQERHVAQAFQEELFRVIPEAGREQRLQELLGVPVPPDPVGAQNALRAGLLKAGKPAYEPETFVAMPHAWELILEMGGLPCYPVLADGARPVCEAEADPELLANQLLDLNLHAAEFIPNRNDPAVLQSYVTTLRQRGIAVSAGTEHNTLERLPLRPAARNGQALPPEVERIFWEGTCVITAHQHFTQRGEVGLVDRGGRRSAWSLEALAEVGAELLANN